MEKKLKILFISQVTIFSLDDKNIYTDLIHEFLEHGHFVTVISAYERRNIGKFQRKTYPENFQLYKITTPNLQKTTKIEKAVGHLAFDFQLLYMLKKHLANKEFDICLYFSPPITITKTLAFVKKKYGTFNYLWLKDIFPQNAVDMGLMRSNSCTHKYFKSIERKYYDLSDKIGVMSPANKDYLIQNACGNNLDSKVEVCPNCIKINNELVNAQDQGLENDILKLVYGGNLGIPQAISFLIEILAYFLNHPKIKFEIIGSGTEYVNLEKWVNTHSPNNVSLRSHLPKSEFNSKVLKADMGLIFLNHQFTIPNFPSRLLTYLECKKPVLCFTDENTDIGKIAKQNDFGDWVPSNDVSNAVKLINHYLQKPKAELNRMGDNGYAYMLKNYTTLSAYELIISSYKSFISKGSWAI